MPDENGTETTRPGAPSANDVLFGDVAKEPATAVAEGADSTEHDAKDANAEDEQGAQDAADAGDKAEAEEKADADENAENDLKVVVVIKGDRATIGVKGASSDPHIESFDGPDLSGLAQEIPEVVERARARWEEAPKHPAHVKPAPPAKRRNRRQQGSAAQAAATEEAEQAQPEAPRLF